MFNVLPASLTIGRPGDYPVEIIVMDRLSRTTFTVHVSRQDLMDALLGMGDVPCSLAMYNRNAIGFKREVKTVSIDMTNVHYAPDVWQSTAIQRLTEAGHLDGEGATTPWMPQTLEHNNHRITKGMFSVVLTRFVPATDDDVNAAYDEMGDHRLDSQPPIPRPKER